MNISVILCTYNRCESLRQALESVAQCEVPGSMWEVLVVDNNSNDQTRDVVLEFEKNYPGRFRYLFEAKSGKSNALNSGIRESCGEILAFMDDDVVVEAGWLRSLTSVLSDTSYAGAGGRILPRWTSAPPLWLPTKERYGLAPLAMFDLGDESQALTEAPFGTNMAFRRSVFEKHAGFRADLGPRPGSEIRNEDTEFGQRVLDAGEHLRYEPRAVVHHAVPENRLKKKYFLHWWFDKARADIREFGVPKDTRWVIAGIPLYFFRRLVAWTVRWITTFEPGDRFSCKLKVWSIIGSIQECRRAHREEARK